jgi:hypothetical protein
VGDIISARYDAKLPTIVTTELAFTDIINVYGKHAAYKLSEDENSDGGGMIINCGNASVRSDDWETGEDEELDSGFLSGRKFESEAGSRDDEDVL